MFSLYILLAIPVVVIIMIIIGGIRFFLRRRSGAHGGGAITIADSKEDAVSQLFFLLSVFFLGATLLVVNRKLESSLSWETILLIMSIAGIVVAYYYNVVLNIVIWTVGVVIWWGVKAVEWSEISITNTQVKIAGVIIGMAFISLIFYILGRMHEVRPNLKKFSIFYMALGGLFFTGLLFFLSTKPGLDLMQYMTSGASIFSSWQISLSIILFFIIFVGTLAYSLSRHLISSEESISLSVLLVLFGSILFLPEQNLFNGYYYRSELLGAGVFWATVFNILIFTESLGIIASGYFRKEEWMVNVGALFLFLLIIIKYFDWFFTFLDKSVFFIGAGVILFVVGWFMEKGRRKMLDTIKEEEAVSV